GVVYLGPTDGHAPAAFAPAFPVAREAAEYPARAGVVFHVVTRTGAGFERAEADAMDHWHATGPFALEASAGPDDPVPPPADETATPTTWTARLGSALLEAAEEDERGVAVRAAMLVPDGRMAMQRELAERARGAC